jgi:hypothetical protein
MGWGVNSSEDARHCSVIYIRKYFVAGLFVGKYNRSQIYECREIGNESARAVSFLGIHQSDFLCSVEQNEESKYFYF